MSEQPHIAVSGDDVHIAVNSGPATLVVGGAGDPLGAVLGNVVVDNGDPAGTAVGQWTANDREYSDDGHGDKLLAPLSPRDTQTGYWVLVQRGGSTLVRRARFVPYGAHGTYRVAVSEDNSYSEALDVKYDGDDSGLNPFFQVLPVAGKRAPDGTRVYVHQANAAPDAAITRAHVAAIEAEQSHLEAEIVAIHDQDGTLPPSATEAEAEEGSGTAQRLWSPLRIVQLLAAWLTRARLALLTGGWVRSGSASGNTLSLVHVRPDGTSETIAFTPTDPGGGGGITVPQATDAAGALLSTLPEFEYDAQTSTLTYTPPAPARPTNVTLNDLAAALQTLITSHLTSRSAVVTALQAFEDALRQTVHGPSGAWTQHLSGVYYAVPATWPIVYDSDVVTVTVTTESGTVLSATVSGEAWVATSSRAAATAGDANGVRLDDKAAAATYWVSKDDDRGVLLASDTTGTHALTSTSISRITIQARHIGNGQVTLEKLSPEVQADIEQGQQSGLTEPEARAIADQEIAKRQAPVDEVAHKSFTATNLPEGEVGAININLAYGGATVASIERDPDSGDIEIRATPGGAGEDLAGKHIGWGPWKQGFNSAVLKGPLPDDAGVYRWLWTDQPANAIVAGTEYRLSIYDPNDESNSVPAGSAATEGWVPVWMQATRRYVLRAVSVLWEGLPQRLKDALRTVEDHEEAFESAVLDDLFTTDQVVADATLAFAENTWKKVVSLQDFGAHDLYEVHVSDASGVAAASAMVKASDIPLSTGAAAGGTANDSFYRHVMLLDGDVGATTHYVYVGRDARGKWYLAFSEAGDHQFRVEGHQPVTPKPTAADEGKTPVVQSTGRYALDYAAPQATRVETAPTAPRHGQRILMLADQTIDGWGVLKASQYNNAGPVGYAPPAEFTHPFGQLIDASTGSAFSTDIVRRIYSGGEGGNTEVWTYLTTQVVSKLLVAPLDANGVPGAFVSHDLTNVPDAGGQRTQQNTVAGNPAFEAGQTYLVKVEDGAARNVFGSIDLEEPYEYDWGDGRWVLVTEQIKAWALEDGPDPTLADLGIVRLTQAAYNALGAGVDAGTLYIIIG